MKIQIIASHHCPLRDRLPKLAEQLAAQGHDVTLAPVAGQAIRTVPSIVADGVVLDVETVEDLAIERIISAKAPPVVVLEPDPRDVLIAALVAKVGAPTKEELTAARASLMPVAAVSEVPAVEEKP